MPADTICVRDRFSDMTVTVFELIEFGFREPEKNHILLLSAAVIAGFVYRPKLISLILFYRIYIRNSASQG